VILDARIRCEECGETFAGYVAEFCHRAGRTACRADVRDTHVREPSGAWRLRRPGEDRQTKHKAWEMPAGFELE